MYMFMYEIALDFNDHIRKLITIIDKFMYKITLITLCTTFLFSFFLNLRTIKTIRMRALTASDLPT